MTVISALRHPPHFEDLADLQEFARPLQISLARINPNFRHNRGEGAGDPVLPPAPAGVTIKTAKNANSVVPNFTL